MNKLTNDLQEKIKQMIDKGCTDSDIEDFCECNKVSPKAAFHFISMLHAPSQCQGCKNVDFLPNMSPCISCCRIHQKDNFEPEVSLFSLLA